MIGLILCLDHNGLSLFGRQLRQLRSQVGHDVGLFACLFAFAELVALLLLWFLFYVQHAVLFVQDDWNCWVDDGHRRMGFIALLATYLFLEKILHIVSCLIYIYIYIVYIL